ncbi:MAG: AMP-binding protein [Oscillospiraceae bacterium]|nr:AMP-binding protein [Oscillospiraceae bacterium]
METKTMDTKLVEVGARIREMREISGYSVSEMAKLTEVSVKEYQAYEDGLADFPFTFIHKCALAFSIEITDILEGHSAKLSAYTITRRGQGQTTADEKGIRIQSLAPQFKKKLAEPYWVRYSYDEALQNVPIHLTRHSGQEFDVVISGSLKVQIGDHIEVLHEGDSIFYNSSAPHGMIAADGRDCLFVAVVMTGEEEETASYPALQPTVRSEEAMVVQPFIDTVEDAEGRLQEIRFFNEDSFNFAYDVVDALGKSKPDKLAMVWLDHNKNEKRFTFKDMMKESSRTANYFKALGIKRGDRVIVLLKRHYQFWFTILALHKLGAIIIPATNLLQKHDFDYRFEAAGITAIVCTGDGDTAREAEKSMAEHPEVALRILVGEPREGWHDFNSEYKMYSSNFVRAEDAPCGEDPMLMFFTSGTTGYPKIACHSYKYPLGHYITAKYWHCVEPDGLHFTISETGWGKALWGKLYGQWLCEGAVFVYDFDKFEADDLLPLFAQYNITTFCAPPTMYRMLIKQDISRYDLSSIRHATTAGEAMNPEVFKQFEKSTGLQIMEGFGQTETTLVIGNLIGEAHKLGSMGRPTPQWDVTLLTREGKPADLGETGEICIKTSEKVPCGLFKGYFRDEEHTAEQWHDGFYHTGDLAWRDEDGFFWYVGRADDVIKSSGYRIGPFEIENVIMELPYVLECGVSAAPDPIRGQVVKASIVLTKGTAGTDELKKEIQNYVKSHTAPYKYPRIVEFRESLPKTISGKIQRNKL